MVKLSVNVNKIATLRNARGGERPSVVEAARVCIAAGCHGITVHPRPDERHIRRQDVYDLAAVLWQEYESIEFNIEGFPDKRYLEIVDQVRPTQATLVPDPPDVLTSNAGWDLRGRVDEARGIVERLQAMDVRVSLFLDPDVEQVALAKATGADRIELYTERYAKTFGTPEGEKVCAEYVRAAAAAAEAGLGLNAGHDLDLRNLRFFAESVRGLEEVSIGHALVCDALEMGLSSSVAGYLECLGF